MMDCITGRRGPAPESSTSFAERQAVETSSTIGKADRASGTSGGVKVGRRKWPVAMRHNIWTGHTNARSSPFSLICRYARLRPIGKSSSKTAILDYPRTLTGSLHQEERAGGS